MPSEANFYSGMKVRDIICYSAKLREKDCQSEAECLCSRLELDTEKKIRELSLGNRKKVSIVCALQHNPRLCILDEPTSGLDPLMQREFCWKNGISRELQYFFPLMFYRKYSVTANMLQSFAKEKFLFQIVSTGFRRLMQNG